MSCGNSCVDDQNEPDDNAAQARPINLNSPPYTSTTNNLCSMDEDWYGMSLFAGETLYAKLTFSQNGPGEDLDLIVYRNGVNLTGCDEQNPSNCDPANGQSGTSNETLAWPISEAGSYQLVVKGWAGAENLYDICIGLQASECP